MSFDLHMHSTCSDGTLSPEELIILAAEKGLKGISITDHDSVNAYPDAFIHAKKHQITLIPGIELSCHFKDESTHILGYSFEYAHPAITALCQRHKMRRVNRNRGILENLKALGIEIQEEELERSATGVVGRPHIAKILVQRGLAADISDAFKTYLGEGKKAYFEGEIFSVEEAIQVIHEAKGFAVLAHPHLHYNNAFVRELLNAHSFDGIECEYAIMPAAKNAPWTNYAKQKNLLITGGSDFHGTIKPMIPIGSAVVSSEQIEPLITRFNSHEL